MKLRGAQGTKPRALFGLILLPFALYPTFAASLAVVDSVSGERLLPYYAAYERRFLFDTFIADYAHAFPAMAVITVALVTAALLLQWAAGRQRGTAALVLASECAAMAAAWWLTHRMISGVHGALMFDALVISLAVSWLVASARASLFVGGNA